MKRLPPLVVVVACLATALVLASSQPGVQASSTTFTVNSTADPGDGTCDSTECTLREAITAANVNAGTDTIEFAIPPGGLQTITPMSSLPNITERVTIDGTTQPGYAGSPIIELSGAAIGGSQGEGLWIDGGGSTIRGLVINRFSSRGITLNSSANVVQGNYIGTDASGYIALGNFFGLMIGYSTNNIVGGTSEEERNIISGNTNYGVAIWGRTCTGNVVQGNYIGTSPDGSTALGNGNGGLLLIKGGDANTIGGAEPGMGNVISGNGGDGLLIWPFEPPASGNVIQRNFIGTDATGSIPLGNGLSGISVRDGGDNTIIGGATVGAGNTIAYNGGHGVGVSGTTSTGNSIRGNSIHSNSGLGIENLSGGNGELPPPVISSVDPVSGTACAGCAIDVYSDHVDEGRIYEGSTEADGDGNWSFSGGVSGPYVTATATDAGGNTSEFSAKFAMPFDPVGGIAVLPKLAENGSSSFDYVPLSALAAAVVAALTGGAWYARRRWLG